DQFLRVRQRHDLVRVTVNKEEGNGWFSDAMQWRYGFRRLLDFFRAASLHAIREEQWSENLHVRLFARVPIQKVCRREEDADGAHRGIVAFEWILCTGLPLGGRKGGKRGEVSASGSAGQAQALRINVELAGVLLRVTDRQLDVLI